MYIIPDEITTHLGADSIELISDGDETMLQAAIDGAMVEAKSYLAAFDIAIEFAKSKPAPIDPDADPAPTPEADTRNPLLIIFIKDIAVWHFVNICNVNTSMAIREDRYNRAVAWLKGVQRGELVPDLPALSVEQKTDLITFSSNQKRNNHF
jgi:phage gp36-like protein